MEMHVEIITWLPNTVRSRFSLFSEVSMYPVQQWLASPFDARLPISILYYPLPNGYGQIEVGRLLVG